MITGLQRVWRTLSFGAIVVVLFHSCSEKDPFSSPDDPSQVALVIVLELADGESRNSQGLSKVAIISRVTLSVSATDMETIEEDLSLSSDRKTASGSVEVSRGKARTFTVEAIDANGITQYSGSATQDIERDTETITITTEGHYPAPVELAVTSVFDHSVELEWSQNTDIDFDDYELYRSTSPGVSLSSTLIATVSDQTNTSYLDETTVLNSSYYYRMIVWDTEGLGFWSSEIQAPVELGYDDGGWENFVYSFGSGDRMVSAFACPAYPCFVSRVELYLRDDSGQDGNYRLVIMDSDLNDLFTSVALNTKPEGWIAWDPVWNSREEGTVTNFFLAGIELVNTSGWPEVALDQSSSQQVGYFYDSSEGIWDLIDDLGFPGNFGIRAVVETGGGGSSRMMNHGNVAAGALLLKTSQ